MIGKTISHYEILEKLGEGGMGVVYKARDLDLDRCVAIKVLPPHFSTDEDAVKRFVHEAKAASSLNHSNIGVIHEIGRTGDGQTFIVMACYDGETLREKIDRSGIAQEDALDIATQIAAGLAKAHTKEIVHRDIKPSNILVTDDGEVKIIDFGLAKLAGKTRLTREGSTVGTAAYMSPEQARGEDVDHRSDIFSLGAILYEMLACTPPFKGEHEAALLYEIVHEEPDRLNRHVAGLPDGLQQIVDRTLHKDPVGRFQSAEEMRAEITVLKESAKQSADGKGTLGAASPASWRQRISIILLFVIAAVVIALFLRSRKESIPLGEMSLAVFDFRSLVEQEDPALSAGITELVYIGLVEASPIRVQSPEYVQDLRRRLFGSTEGPIEENQALEIARESEATYVLTGRIGTLGEERFITWRLVDVRSGQSIGAKKIESSEMSSLANKIVEAVLPLIASYSGIEEEIEQVPVEQITTDKSPAYEHYIRGKLLQRQGQSDDAHEEYERAIAIDSSFALAYLGISQLNFGSTISSGLNLDRARYYSDLAWKHRSRLGIKDRMWLEALRYSIDYRVSEEISVLLEIHTRWPDDREAIYNLVNRCHFWGMLKETVIFSEKGRQLFPDDIQIGGPSYFNALASLGRIDEAYRATLEFVERDPMNPNAWDELGWRYLVMDYPDSAKGAFRKALEIDPNWGNAILTSCDYYAGHLNQAISALEQILNSGSLGESERMRLMLQRYGSMSLSGLYLEAGRHRDVIHICDKYMDSVWGHPVYLYFIGRLYIETDQMEKASGVITKMSESEKTGLQVNALNIRGKLLLSAGEFGEALKVAGHLNELAESRGYFLHQHALQIKAEAALGMDDPTAALKALKEWHDIGVWPLGLLHIYYLEMLADAFRMDGQTEKAIETHQDLLRIFGGHALSHYELGKLYEKLERPGDARQEYEIFLGMWAQADEGLPQPVDARRRLASLTSH